MRVLLDESVPRQLAPLLSSHSVSTVPREGWEGIDNGELLDRAVQRFDVLVTGDQSLQYQQNLSGRQLGVVVIAAPDNRVRTITALAPDVLAALTQIEHGEVIKVPQRQSARDRRRSLR